MPESITVNLQAITNLLEAIGLVSPTEVTSPTDTPEVLENDIMLSEGVGRFAHTQEYIETDTPEYTVTSIVLEPDVPGPDGEWYTKETIRKASFDFMQMGQTIKLQHSGYTYEAPIVENYLAPTNLTLGNQSVPEGTWVMTLRIQSEPIWVAIKRGNLTGLSIGGRYAL